MDIGDNNPLKGSLVFTAKLPVAWRKREDVAGDDFSRQAEHNEHVLRCANLLGEQVRDKLDEESETDQALVRLEAKVNLLLELVSKLDQRVSQIPDLHEMKLSSGGIEWVCSTPVPESGEAIWVELYIDNRIPESMQIPANVVSVSQGANSSIVLAGFESLGDVVKDQLEKLIFRHHRRMIAHAKSG